MKDKSNGGDNSNDAAFKRLVDLLALYSEAENRLEHLQAEQNEVQLQAVDEVKDEYAELQQTLITVEAEAQALCMKHPEWFEKKKTITTPYGSAKLADNPPKLVAPNEELSIVLLEVEAEKTRNADKPFAAAPFIRVERHLNHEALEQLTDEELAKFRIQRTRGKSFTVKGVKMDLGKAVSELTAKEAA